MRLLRLTAITLILATSAIAITRANLKEKKVIATYEYRGDNTLTQQRQAANYWNLNDSNPQFTCDDVPDIICEIQTDDAGLHPDFSAGNPVDNPGAFTSISKRSN